MEAYLTVLTIRLTYWLGLENVPDALFQVRAMLLAGAAVAVMMIVKATLSRRAGKKMLACVALAVGVLLASHGSINVSRTDCATDMECELLSD